MRLNYAQPYCEPESFLLTLAELSCQRGMVSSGAQISSHIQPLGVGGQVGKVSVLTVIQRLTHPNCLVCVLQIGNT